MQNQAQGPSARGPENERLGELWAQRRYTQGLYGGVVLNRPSSSNFHKISVGNYTTRWLTIRHRIWVKLSLLNILSTSGISLTTMYRETQRGWDVT